MLAIETNGVTKSYGGARGVRNICLSVAEGEMFGFIGPNGAGKSTTIRMLIGLSAPDSGDVRLFGEPLKKDDPLPRRDIGYLPSEVNFYKDFTGEELLAFAARAYGLTLKQTKANALAERLQFDMKRKVKSYSLGNRKKLGIIHALLHEPKLLILDEPTSGLDPLVQQSFFDILKERNREGTTVFFSTHVLPEVEKVCGKVAFIKEGEIQRVSAVGDIPGKRQLRIAVTYEEDGDKIEGYGLRAIDPHVTFKDGEHHFTVLSSISETLRLIANRPIRDIAVRKPTLEELFMSYYEKEGNGR